MEVFLSPEAIKEETIKKAEKKVSLKWYQTFLLSVFAGAFIALGAHGYLVVMQTLKAIDVGLMKFMGAAVFPIGLMLVLMAGGELFTGNCLISLAFMSKKIKLKDICKNWFWVYFGNLIGAVLIAMALYYVEAYGISGEINKVGKLAHSVAYFKTSHTFMQSIVKGILCNIIVVLSVWLSYGAKDGITKIFTIWFPVMLFILSGFEHSIANMFLLPIAKFSGADITWTIIIMKNLIPVTIGNIIGGALIVPIVYHFALKSK